MSIKKFQHLKVQATRSSVFATLRWALIFFVVSSEFCLATLPPLDLKRIDAEKTLIGQEHTAQDQEMIDEPGRSSGPTEHRWKKLKEFVADFRVRMKVKKKSAVRERKNSDDPGYYINTKPDGEYRVNMEPVTIEVNSPPPNIYGLRSMAAPIYESFTAVGLTPYLRPAAERSGMGHAHLGAATLRESPFFIYPNLLPNLMVYLHNNPAALFALSEAYDMGRNSNMETYHFAPKQEVFAKAIETFHKWYLENPKKIKSLGLATFVKIMKETSLDPTEHYRYINFERLGNLKLGPKKERLSQEELTAATVEVRVIRPYKSVDHAEAVGYYLLKLLDYLSDPELLLKVQKVGREDFQFYYSGSAIAANWKNVKKDISFEHPLVEEMVNEYIENVRDRVYQAQGLPPASVISAAYSRKEEKGKRFELRIPVTTDVAPDIALGGFRIPLRKFEIEKQSFWVGVFHIDDFGISSKEVVEGQLQFIVGNKAKSLPLREIKTRRFKAPSIDIAAPRFSQFRDSRSSMNFATPISTDKNPKLSLVDAIKVKATDANLPEAIQSLEIYAIRAEDDFFRNQINSDLAKVFLDSNNLFLRLKGFLHFAIQKDFEPSELDLVGISKGLQNHTFSDNQMKYSLVASQILLKYRSKSHRVQEELRATALHESDWQISTNALAAFIANGGPRDSLIVSAVESVLRKLERREESEEVLRMKSFFKASLGRNTEITRSQVIKCGTLMVGQK